MGKGIRLSKLARELNVGITTIVEFLHKKGIEIDQDPNSKVSAEHENLLKRAFSSDYDAKKQSEKLSLRISKERKQSLTLNDVKPTEKEEPEKNEKVLHIKDISGSNIKDEIRKKREVQESFPEKQSYKVIGKIDLENLNKKTEKETIEQHKTEIEEEEYHQEQTLEPVIEFEHEEKHVEPEIYSEVEQHETTEIYEKPIHEKVEELNNQQNFEEHYPEETIKENNTLDKEIIPVVPEPENKTSVEPERKEIKIIGRINLDNLNQKTRPDKKTRKQKLDEKKKSFDEKAKSFEERTKPFEERTKKIVLKSTWESENNQREEVKSSENLEIRLKDDDSSNNFLKTKVEKLTGPTVIGKMDLPIEPGKKKLIATSLDAPQTNSRKRRKRKRVQKKFNEEQKSTSPSTPTTPLLITKKKDRVETREVEKTKDDSQKHILNKAKKQVKSTSTSTTKKVKKIIKKEVNEEDVQKQIKETLARLTAGRQKSKSAKYRRTKRDMVSMKQKEEKEKMEKEKNILKVTEFVSVNELANMMNVPVNEVISVCMNLGLVVAINQRLDAETIAVVAEEFNFETNFISVELQENIQEEEDREEDLLPRAPIVTVMGHVDHGKTSLLDYIRKTNVIAGEAGGITQHIGAYSVEVGGGKRITFLDTPGHEAFTAMRARGAQVTDIAIIVVAADDSVMPQTIEAINHASAAGVPIVFAINKIDKSGANAERIKEQLAKMNYLVEDWGGKYQSQEISAKQGINVELLLEKVLLEAEILELRANPNKNAIGTIIESSLEKGRGYVTTLLVENGTLNVGDVILAGTFTGKIKAMYNERDKRVDNVKPAEPVLILGLNGAPQAGDRFHIMNSEKEAREIATKRNQLQREQSMRAQKHITLDEIGRRIAIGNFKELNIIVKGDVDGSIEALSDSLIKLSNSEIQVNIIHKAVGQIIESDVMLAAASNAIIVGFQVRPSLGARRLSEKEGIDVRLYSIIYDAINEVKDAMQGMLSPEMKEEILGTAEVREVFKITKVGTVAGCMVRDGKIMRNSRVRLIREGIVVFTGDVLALKRFKEDMKEVKSGFECGISIDRFNDIKEGDTIEAFRQVEIERKLE